MKAVTSIWALNHDNGSFLPPI